jgi:hypothetical protein
MATLIGTNLGILVSQQGKYLPNPLGYLGNCAVTTLLEAHYDKLRIHSGELGQEIGRVERRFTQQNGEVLKPAGVTSQQAERRSFPMRIVAQVAVAMQSVFGTSIAIFPGDKNSAA